MTVTVSATPAENHKFSGWSENSSVVSEDEDYTFAVTGDRSLVAGFTEKPPSRLPEGYTEVEYLHLSGQFVLNAAGAMTFSTFRVIFDIDMDSYSGADEYLFSGSGQTSSSTSVTYFNLYRYANTGFKFLNSSSTSNATILSTGDVSGKRIIIDFNAPQKTVSIGDFNKSNLSILSTKFKYDYIMIGAKTSGTIFPSSKLYSCKLYFGETLQRDYVPCTNDSGKAGLYDLVSNYFYTSSGTVTPGPAI